MNTGFEDQKECVESQLTWQGIVPPWLTGTLYRNGPGQYDRGQVEVSHWFDGLALLHAFHIRSDGVTYLSRFLRSRDYLRADLDGEIDSPGFCCDPCRTLFRKLASAFLLDATDNSNVNLVKQGERFFALTEIPLPIEFHPKTLGTLAHHRYLDKIGEGSTTAHPHQVDGILYNHLLHYSAFPSYRLYRQSQFERRKEYARVTVNHVSYMHSFGLSQNYAVLACCPYLVSPLSLLLRNRPFIENFTWEPHRGTVFHLVPRPGARGFKKTLTGEAFFSFHHVNSFELNNDIFLDLICYPNADIVLQLKLERLRNNQSIDFGKLRRYRLPTRRGGPELLWESKHCLELPRIHYAQVNTRDYQYVYGISADQAKSHFYDRLIKLDVRDDSAIYWQEEGCYPGEPVFVPEPGGNNEDQGLILSVVLSGLKGRSFLLVLDAQSFREVARAWMPTIVGHGFHGFFDGA